MKNKKTRFIAFYLPQYHRIPENDKWWGKGFTDWMNVKKAKPLFKDHYQPRVPLNDNYYNLLNKKTLIWQADLAKKYGIYGFCFYHYWFTGKKLLEKPAELFLKSKDIDIPFCFSWANHHWNKGWDGQENEILIKQEYGDEKDWNKHFNYLLDFFKDKRYIKIDNRPIIVIYESYSIKNIDKWIGLWDKLAKKNGFDGIYFIENFNGRQGKTFSNLSKGVIEFEPTHEIFLSSSNVKYLISQKSPLIFRITFFIKKIVLKFIPVHKIPYFDRIYSLKRYLDKKINSLFLSSNRIENKIDYDLVWKNIINRKRSIKGKKPYLGAFIDWDNTPRKKRLGLVFNGATPHKFREYLAIQLNKAKKYNSEFIFINAWNEWAEGAYLEPDKKWGYGYLEAIRDVESSKDN